MNVTLSEAALQTCRDKMQSDLTTARLRLPGVEDLLFYNSLGVVCQALIAGSCLQLVYHYCYQPKRDSTLARIALAWVTAISLCHVGITNYQVTRVQRYHDRYVAVLFNDWWLYQLSYLLFVLAACPILLFFTHRAYIVWDRSKLVLSLCLLFIAPAFVLGITSSALGLVAPWGLDPLSNAQFVEWSSTFGRYHRQSHNFLVATIVSQLLAALVVCFTVCYGIFRHRNGFAQLDSAISKVVFLCGESLLPVVFVALVDTVRAFMTRQATCVILSRLCVQIAPLLYFHGLMSALVSRERVAIILSAEPVRQMASFSAEPNTPDKHSAGPETPDLLPSYPKINWTTLQLEAAAADQALPDFVDRSKVVYGCNTNQLLSDAESGLLTPEMKVAYWTRRTSAFSVEVGVSTHEGDERDECGLEEILRRGPDALQPREARSREMSRTSTLRAFKTPLGGVGQ